MDKKIIIGVDPGQSGAIVFMRDDKIFAVEDMPTMPRPYGKGVQVSAGGLCNIFSKHIMLKDSVICFIEAVHSMPKQGVVSTFKFGESLGIVIGVMGALGINHRFVTPQAWKKRLNLIGQPKRASLILARKLHPEVSDKLTLVKHNDRADAICMADYGNILFKG